MRLMATENKVKTALYITPRQIRALKAIAKQREIPMSQVIREGINLVIQKNEKTP